MSAFSGSVPSQGVVISEAVSAKKRNDRGKVGVATAGDRVKKAWSDFNAKQGAPKHMVNLREFVRHHVFAADKELSMDVAKWLNSKRPHGGPATVAARNERFTRIAGLNAQRESKGSKSKMSVPKKETSRR